MGEETEGTHNVIMFILKIVNYLEKTRWRPIKKAIVNPCFTHTQRREEEEGGLILNFKSENSHHLLFVL